MLIELASTNDATRRKRPVCLVLMPMYAGFERIRALVARTLARAELEMCRLEQEVRDVDWHVWLLNSLERASIVLADMTDHNPYVMYELGAAHQRGIPAVLIMSAAEDQLPATVRGSLGVLYGHDEVRFERNLAACLQASLARTAPSTRAEAELSLPNQTIWYQRALEIADRFGAETGDDIPRVSADEFRSRLSVSTRRGTPLPDDANPQVLAGVLLALVLSDSHRSRVIDSIWAWTSGRMGSERS